MRRCGVFVFVQAVAFALIASCSDSRGRGNKRRKDKRKDLCIGRGEEKKACLDVGDGARMRTTGPVRLKWKTERRRTKHSDSTACVRKGIVRGTERSTRRLYNGQHRDKKRLLGAVYHSYFFFIIFCLFRKKRAVIWYLSFHKTHGLQLTNRQTEELFMATVNHSVFVCLACFSAFPKTKTERPANGHCHKTNIVFSF